MKTYIDTIESGKDIYTVLADYTVPRLKELLKLNGCVKYSKMNRRELYTYCIMLNACKCIQNKFIKWNLRYLNDIDPITLDPIHSYNKKLIFNRILKINGVYYCTRYLINKYADYILASGDIYDLYTKLPLTIKDLCKIDTQLINTNFHYPRLKTLLQNKPNNSYDYLLGLERQLNDHVTNIRDFCTGDLYLDSGDSIHNSEDKCIIIINYLTNVYLNDIHYIINRIRDVDTEYAQFVINDITEYIKNPNNNPDKSLVNNIINIIHNI